MGIKNIFSKYFWKKYFWKYFSKKYFQKYFWYPSVIPFWNRENYSYRMALLKKWFWAIQKKIFFQIQRGGPLVQKKRFLLCRGVIFQKKKFCVFGSLSNMSKNALLSASGWNPKLHNYHPPLPIGDLQHTTSLNFHLKRLVIRHHLLTSNLRDWLLYIIS